MAKAKQRTDTLELYYRLRIAGRCPTRCVVETGLREAIFRDAEGGVMWSGTVLYGLHNGSEVVLPLSVDGVAPDYPWLVVREEWASRIGALHREEAMQSDWPVF